VAETIRPDEERGDREIAGRGKKDEATRRKRASQFVLRGRHDAYISVRLIARAAPVGRANGRASTIRKLAVELMFGNQSRSIATDPRCVPIGR
jgi:hypothetical protein